MKTDIEISQSFKLKDITSIAKKIGLNKKQIMLYGKDKAKVELCYGEKNGKLVLVTAINPTAFGNGKTTVSIGLADAFAKNKKSVCLALREPSLGPVFGIKGGATGGGYSQIVPMEDINLHFTGDFHAITSANNFLCSLLDNHIFHGNELDINADTICFHRCLDLNERALRDITICQSNGATPRREQFIITAASEIMAIMCLANDLNDLKKRLGNIIVAFNRKGKPVFARDLKAEDAMTILLKETIKPNLVQTMGGSPALVHCGPFANIAHGCNSIIATKMALSRADYCITEAGFGADLGAEKFFDLKCRLAGLKPDCVVLIATIPALKLHGGVDKESFKQENTQAVKRGLENLMAHIDSLKNIFKVKLVVTLNLFESDFLSERQIVKDAMKELDIEYAENNVWAEGGKGGQELMTKVERLCNADNCFDFCYNNDESIKSKIEKIAKKVYGAGEVLYLEQAEQSIRKYEKLAKGFPVVMAKTQASITDDAKVLGAPKGFSITVRDIEIRNGAGFVVVLLGKMLLMPALPKVPASDNMSIDQNGIIKGLF